MEQIICGQNEKLQIDRCIKNDGFWFDAGELEAVAKLEKSGLDKLFGVFGK